MCRWLNRRLLQRRSVLYCTVLCATVSQTRGGGRVGFGFAGERFAAQCSAESCKFRPSSAAKRHARPHSAAHAQLTHPHTLTLFCAPLRNEDEGTKDRRASRQAGKPKPTTDCQKHKAKAKPCVCVIVASLSNHKPPTTIQQGKGPPLSLFSFPFLPSLARLAYTTSLHHAPPHRATLSPPHTRRERERESERRKGHTATTGPRLTARPG